jgi:hypothetical protein
MFSLAATMSSGTSHGCTRAGGFKGEAFWLGGKLHVSETCDNAPGARA